MQFAVQFVLKVDEPLEHVIVGVADAVKVGFWFTVKVTVADAVQLVMLFVPVTV